MLVIKVELWPFGREEYKRTIASAKIINDATGNYDFGNYTAEFEEYGDAAKHNSPKFSSVVKSHDRRSSVWYLILKAIAAGVTPKPAA